MMQNLFTLDELVISQTKSLLKDRFMISDVNGTPVGTIVQSTSLKEMVFKPSRSLEVALTDAEGNPQQTVMTISDPANFLRDTYEVHLPGIEQPMAVITKRFSMFKTKMELTMEGFADVEVHGDFWDWNLTITSQDRQLADVSNKWTGIGNYFMGKNTYLLRIAPDLNEQQHAAVIGAVMSMDMLRTKKRKTATRCAHGHHCKRCFRTGPTVSTEVPIPDTTSAAAGPMALTTGAPMMYPISIAELFIDPIVERALGLTPSGTVPTTMIRSAAT